MQKLEKNKSFCYTLAALGGTRKQAVDKNGEHYELREFFDAYMRFGGMPGIADVGLDQEKAMMLLEGIKSINLCDWLLGD